MDDARTSARVRTLRAACALPLAQLYGSLEGRLDGAARVALEPDGRHAAVVLDGAIERWDLDAIERVGRWEAPAPSRWGRAVCVGEAPAGLRLVDVVGLWRPAPRADAWEALLTFADNAEAPTAPDVLLVSEPGALRAVDFADGSTRWRAALGGWRGDVTFARGGRAFLRRMSAASFDVVALVDAPPDAQGPRAAERVAARLATPEPTQGGARAFGALHAAGKLAAVATREGVLLGRWDDWWSATLVPDTKERALAIEFTHDACALVIFEERRVVRVDVATREIHAVRGSQPLTATRGVPLAARSGRVLCVENGVFEVLDEGASAFRARAHDPVGFIRCAAGTRDGRALVTGASDGVLRVRDRATGETLAQVESGAFVCDVAVSPDDREAIALLDTGELARHDLTTGALLGRHGTSTHPDDFRGGRHGRLAVDAAGRFAAVCDDGPDPAEFTVVDVASGHARRLRTREEGPDDTSLSDVRFCAPGQLRVVTHTADGGAHREFIEEHVLDDAERPALRRPLSVSEPDLDQDEHRLSRDGRRVWRTGRPLEGGGRVVTVVAADGSGAERRWGVDHERGNWCVGTSLFAASNGHDALWLLASHGASVRADWPRGCAPLAFSPDDRALWVRDASGVVVEVSVPDSLIAPA